MDGSIYSRARLGLALAGLVPSLACSPKVHLEFDDTTSTFGWEDGSGTGEPAGDDRSSRFDDDDGGPTPGDESGWASWYTSDDDGGSPTTTSGWATTIVDTIGPTSTSLTPDTTGSWDSGDVECFNNDQCAIGFECQTHVCVPVDPCADGLCCPSGIVDAQGNCCEFGVDPYGECAPPSCVRDSDCPAHHVCSHEDLCTPIAATPECGSLSPLTSLPLEVRTGAVERVTVGDLDGNGTRDGLVAHQNTEGSLWVFPGLSQSNEATIESTAALDYYVTDLALADFDEDGIDDLVLSFSEIDVTHIDLSSAAASSQLHAHGLWDIKTGDLDGDGHLDIVGADGWLQIFFGAGDGSFEHFDPGLPARAVAVGDFEGDGITDVVVADSGFIAVYGFDSDRVGVIKSERSTRAEPADVFLSDLEGDGIHEFGLLGFVTSGSALYVWSSGDTTDAEPIAAYFPDTYLGVAVPAPPDDRYLVLAGSSGQVHVRDLMPPCWNLFDPTPVWDLATGFDPTGSGERLLLSTGSSGLRVTR